MLSHADLAEMTAASYGEAPTLSLAADVRCVVRRVGDETAVICPGTVSIEGWLRDFSAWPAWLPRLGPMHEGFGSGGWALWREVWPLLGGRRVTYAGHSLGGAVALVLAALHARHRRARRAWPCRVVVFGAPRVPFMLNPIFHFIGADATAYERWGDPVPGVPFRPWYRRGVRSTTIGTRIVSIDALRNHAIALYAADLRALEQAGGGRR